MIVFRAIIYTNNLLFFNIRALAIRHSPFATRHSLLRLTNANKFYIKRIHLFVINISLIIVISAIIVLMIFVISRKLHVKSMKY